MLFHDAGYDHSYGFFLLAYMHVAFYYIFLVIIYVLILTQMFWIYIYIFWL